MLSKYITVLISPLGTAILLNLIALTLLKINKFKKFAFPIFAIALFWIYFWSTPIVSYHLRLYLESAYPPIALSEIPNAGAIVILGGGVSPGQPRYEFINLRNAADRVYQGAKLYKANKSKLIILTGGVGLQYSSDESEAYAMATFIQDFGVPVIPPPLNLS